MDIPDKVDITPERFIHGVAKLMANWGMPHTAARVYAYLLLQPKPAGLDQIAADLGISRAGAWAAARHLEQVNQVERYGQPGSKRALFAPTENFARSMLNYSRLLSRMGTLLRDGASVAEGEAAARLQERSELYLTVHDAIEATIEELMTERRQAAQ
jgi:hypothetical protein